MRDYPDDARKELQFSEENPTGKEVSQIFGEETYDDANDKRAKEGEIYYNFTNAIDAIANDEYKTTHNVTELYWDNDIGDKETKEDENDKEGIKISEKVIQITDVCRFITGSKYPMRSMIGKGAIIFQHYDTDEERTKNKGTRMTANTCAYSITNPVTDRYTCDEEEFLTNFVHDIYESAGFGKV